MSSNVVGVAGLLAAFEESGDFYSPAPGEYTFKIVSAYDGAKPLNCSMYLEVQGGPDSGKKWLTTYGSLSGNGAGMAMKQWALAGVTPEFIASLGTDDFPTIVKAVRAALIGVVLSCTVAPQGGTGQYADNPNIVFKTIKLISRDALPAGGAAVAGTPAVPSAPTGLPTGPAAASAPATVPVAGQAPSAAPAAAPAGDADLAAQIAALQAQQAAQMATASPNGVVTGAPAPAIATDEDPGF